MFTTGTVAARKFWISWRNSGIQGETVWETSYAPGRDIWKPSCSFVSFNISDFIMHTVIQLFALALPERLPSHQGPLESTVGLKWACALIRWRKSVRMLVAWSKKIKEWPPKPEAFLKDLCPLSINVCKASPPCCKKTKNDLLICGIVGGSLSFCIGYAYDGFSRISFGKYRRYLEFCFY